MNQKYEEELLELEIKNLEYWSKFYKEETEKKENRLKEFGYDKNDLFQSKKCEEKFGNLIEIAHKLNLSNIDESSYLMAISDLFAEKFKHKKFKITRNHESNKLNEDLKQFNLFHETLKRDYQKLILDVANKKQKFEKSKESLEFKQAKIEKYNNQVQEFEVYEANIDKYLMHEKILERNEALEDIQTKLIEQEHILEEHHGLPPNIELANERVDAIKREILELDKNVNHFLDIVN